jgi:hypothetical protein
LAISAIATAIAWWPTMSTRKARSAFERGAFAEAGDAIAIAASMVTAATMRASCRAGLTAVIEPPEGFAMSDASQDSAIEAALLEGGGQLMRT